MRPARHLVSFLLASFVLSVPVLSMAQPYVRNIEHLSGNLIIHGGQDGRGWTLTISEQTGKMSATISADGEGFVVFGACTLS